jgi:hypothetical protein
MDELFQKVEASDALPNSRSRASERADELEIARRRMKHLTPWHVRPMPMYRGTRAGQVVRVGGASEERCHRLALQVRAVQMAQALPKSALS